MIATARPHAVAQQLYKHNLPDSCSVVDCVYMKFCIALKVLHNTLHHCYVNELFDIHFQEVCGIIAVEVFLNKIYN